MNNLKDKNLKKLISSKLLYALPLAGMGLISTHQTTHAMFTKKQPTTTQPPSTSRNTLTTTTPTTSTPSRLSTSAIGSKTNLGARPKTTTTTSSLPSSPVSSTSSSYGDSKEELQVMKTSGNLGNSIKDLVKQAFESKLYTVSSSSNQDSNEISDSLSFAVKEMSSSAFRKKVYESSHKTGKLLTHENMKNINEASEEFGDAISSVISSHMKRANSNLEDIKINEKDSNIISEKAKSISYVLGEDVETATNHLLATQVDKLIESNK